MLIGKLKSGWYPDPEEEGKPQAITESNPSLEFLRQLGELKPIHRRVPLTPVEPTPPDAPKPDEASGDEAPNQP